MSIHFSNDSITLHDGHALTVARTLEDGSADCIVTSPPYYKLRDYGTEGQSGAEATLEDYVDGLRDLFHELRRVLADDGTLWLNVGDSYGPRKQLLMTPARVALALQSDGWILRNDVIWHKPNAMPEPVRDRLNARFEHIFLFSKKTRYFFDLDPIREPLLNPGAADGSRIFGGKNKAAALNTGSSARRTGRAYTATSTKGKNPGDVWKISTRPFREAHFATFPRDIPERAILSGCKPGGTVLDPFSGSSTTGMVALEHGRTFVGIDNKPEYHDLALRTRLAPWT